MKIINEIGAQGDVLFVRVDRLPEGLEKDKASEPVVAHSETGHHHVAKKRKGFTVERFIQDEMTSYLRIRKQKDELLEQADQAAATIDAALASVGVEIEHRRDYDTHEAFGLACEEDEAVYEVKRQEELRPEGWAQVQD